MEHDTVREMVPDGECSFGWKGMREINKHHIVIATGAFLGVIFVYAVIRPILGETDVARLVLSGQVETRVDVVVEPTETDARVIWSTNAISPIMMSAHKIDDGAQSVTLQKKMHRPLAPSLQGQESDVEHLFRVPVEAVGPNEQILIQFTVQ